MVIHTVSLLRAFIVPHEKDRGARARSPRVAGHVAHYFECHLGYIDVALNLAAYLSLFSGIGT